MCGFMTLRIYGALHLPAFADLAQLLHSELSDSFERRLIVSVLDRSIHH